MTLIPRVKCIVHVREVLLHNGMLLHSLADAGSEVLVQPLQGGCCACTLLVFIWTNVVYNKLTCTCGQNRVFEQVTEACTDSKTTKATPTTKMSCNQKDERVSHSLTSTTHKRLRELGLALLRVSEVGGRYGGEQPAEALEAHASKMRRLRAEMEKAGGGGDEKFREMFMESYEECGPGTGEFIANLVGEDDTKTAEIVTIMEQLNEDEQKDFHDLFMRHMSEVLGCKDTTMSFLFADGYTNEDFQRRLAVTLAKLDTARKTNGENFPRKMADGEIKSVEYFFPHHGGRPFSFKIEMAPAAKLLKAGNKRPRED